MKRERPLNGKEQEQWLLLQESLESMPSDLPVSPGEEVLIETYGPEWRHGITADDFTISEPSAAWSSLKDRIVLKARMERNSLRAAAALGALGGLAIGVGVDALIRLVVK